VLAHPGYIPDLNDHTAALQTPMAARQVQNGDGQMTLEDELKEAQRLGMDVKLAKRNYRARERMGRTASAMRNLLGELVALRDDKMLLRDASYAEMVEELDKLVEFRKGL
jgi:hypothetical protein